MTTAPLRVTTEDDLWASYSKDPAVEELRKKARVDRSVRRPCACRGVVEADPVEPTLGVMLHNAGPRHQAWREATS